jgi:transposase
VLDSISQQQIRELHEQGLPIKRIAAKLYISRQTVRKYMNINNVNTQRSHESFNSWLRNNESTVKSLFLRFEGHCVPMQRKVQELYKGSTNLRSLQQFCKKYRQELKKAGASTPVRYETQPGDQLQIDFGEKDVVIGGVKIRIHFFVCVLGYSRRMYVKAFTSENTEAWLNGIESAFRHFGGVPLSVVSDNTKCLVTSHTGRNLVLNERYMAFCRYWKIRPVVCTPYLPRSKGKCERMVRYFKENALSGKEFSSLESLQNWINLWLVQYSDIRELSLPQTTGAKLPAERFIEAEKSELRPFEKPMFTNIREEKRKADKCGLIRVENRLYKLPEQYSNHSVFVQITDTEIIFHEADNKVIRMDKTTSVYTAKPQEKSTPVSENCVSSDFELWGKNALARPLEAYESAIGGTW